MKVIPVIDILGGKVVHAVRGKRKEYQPLKSRLCSSTDPLDVAAAFRKLGFSELYVADLDAILGGKMNLSILRGIAEETGLELMVDAGVDKLEKAERLLENHASKIIIGTETLPTINLVAEAVRLFGNKKVIVSLDLMNGQVLSRLDTAAPMSPMALLQALQEAGASQVIVLDLARVGSGEGVNMRFIEDALKNFHGHIFVGGGLRNIDDLIELEKIGVAGVLVATALHSGKISVDELKRLKLLT
ncbi:MAG: HisA/HisF-related TIM barrel protein [Candidatus Bathyarchaeota archaeon]|nr:HisA/HisF-related TIM barrel protein [Candidatus Bathyarchaeota archaeon]